MSEDEKRSMIEGIGHDAARMEMIVAQLADAARLDAGSLQLDLERVDLRESAAALAEGPGPWPDLELEVSGDAAAVRADRLRLRTILLAALEAVRWWTDPGPVRVRVSAGSRVGEARIGRAGTTLEPSAAEDLFVPRAPGTGGTGKMGLYVARGLAEAQGGTLRAEVDGGLELVVRLPTA